MGRVGKGFYGVLSCLAAVSLLLLPGTYGIARAQQDDLYLPQLESYVSEDGLAAYNAAAPLVVVADPDPSSQGIQMEGPTAAEALDAAAAAGSTFSFTYNAAGTIDPWKQVCDEFPASAKTAFAAAGAIWAKTLQSSVPIKIKACWANLGSPNILGYSGGGPIFRDFTGAPKAHTWYGAALANSLAKSDLDTSHFDMYITYNSNFSWYYGTDGKTPAGQYDLVTVAAHEIGHGLNFSGSASYAGGQGDFGYNGYPNVYDTFMQSAGGKALTSYAHPSAALGTLLTSNSLWFNGTKAKAANGGQRVKIYAPATWSSGSSYSHLDYNTFRGTLNSMMVYAVGSGSSNHNPGPVTVGLLQDLGWKKAATTATVPTPLAPSGSITDRTPTYKWSKVNKATNYRFTLMQGTTNVYTKTVASTACGATVCKSTPTNVLNRLTYKWKVQAKVGGVWKAYSAYKKFTIAAATRPKAGYWQDPAGVDFYVATDRANVNSFSLYLSVQGCGNYKITNSAAAAVANSKFSFTGSFYGNGTFSSVTAAHGTCGLTNFFISGCGTVSAGPWNWTATWQDSSQPVPAMAGNPEVVVRLPDADTR